MEKIGKSFYVDDLVTGVEDEERAYQLFVKSKEMLKDGGFNLHKFSSNSAVWQARVDPKTCSTEHPILRPIEVLEETYTTSTLGPGQEMRPGEQKVLGVQWDIASDHMWSTSMKLLQQRECLSPRNATSSVLWADFMTLSDSWPQLLFVSRCSSKNSVKPSLSGIRHFPRLSWEGGIR